MKLSRLLRLAVTLNHSRGAYPVPVPELISLDKKLTVKMPDGWLEAHPLTTRDLMAEVAAQNSAGFEVEIL